MRANVLIVDDEKNIRRTLRMILSGESHKVREAESGEACLSLMVESPADLILLDVNLPGMDGIEVLRSLHESHPSTAVLMISGEATVSNAVAATRAGAFDFLEKPLSKDRVLLAVRNALAAGELAARVSRFESAEALRHRMVGESPALERVRRHIAKVAPTAATVLITGPSGTGKELVARALHDASPRTGAPFIKVNCAAIPEELIETELFGCVRGAYTGADRDREGKFLLADGGTLFLDEIGDMSLSVQAKLLRALQEGEIQRVGDNRVQTVDVRVVSATNKTLADEVSAGRFREDLFYRLNVVPIQVPSLGERSADIPELCSHFLNLYARENDLPPRTLSPRAMTRLTERAWPGNIRELKNVLERLAILSEDEIITEQDLDAHVPGSMVQAKTADMDTITPESIRDAGGLVEARRRFERACIEACLDRSGGNVTRAARWLGIERSNLHKKMQALDLEARPSRPASHNQGETS